MADEMDSAQPAPQGQNPLVQEYYNTTEARKVEAKAQMDKLIRALDSRRNMPFDPVAMRIAGGFLQPTKTGSFGESLGYATTAGADELEKKAARDAEFAKMEFELGEKMRQQQGLDDQMKFRMKYFGNQPAAGAPAAAPAAAMPSLTAAPPVAAQELSAVPQMSTPEAPAVLPQEMPKAPPPPAAAPPAGAYVPRQIDPMLAVIDPVSYEIEMKRNEAARKDAELLAKQKEAAAKEREQELKEYSVNVHGLTVPMTKDERKQVNEAIAKKDLKTLQSIFLPKGSQSPFIIKDDEVVVMPAEDWKRKQKAAEELGEIKRTIRNKTYLMTGPEAIAHDEAKRIGGKTYRDWVNNYFEGPEGDTVSPTAKPSAAPAARTESVSKAPKSVSEREAEAERSKTFAVKGAEETIKMDQQMAKVANTAAETQRTANTIISLITDPKYSGAQGYFSQPGFKNALVTFLKEGVRVGDFNVGVPSFGEALKKIGMSPDEVNAEALLFQKYGNLQLMVSKLQQGQGSVSNYERSVFEKIGGSIDSPLLAMQSAMNALRARSVFDQRNAESYMKWRDRNPDKATGMVRAIDVDRDVSGHAKPDLMPDIADQIRLAAKAGDKRISYVIFDGKIASAKKGWAFRPYTGINAHRHHLHISFTPKGDTDSTFFNIPLLGGK